MINNIIDNFNRSICSCLLREQKKKTLANLHNVQISKILPPLQYINQEKHYLKTISIFEYLNMTKKKELTTVRTEKNP
jgi:hypothetical protein